MLILKEEKMINEKFLDFIETIPNMFDISGKAWSINEVEQSDFTSDWETLRQDQLRLTKDYEKRIGMLDEQFRQGE